MLRYGSADHRSAAMAADEPDKVAAGFSQAALQFAQRTTADQHGGGVEDVLAGGPEVHIVAGSGNGLVRSQLKLPDEVDSRVGSEGDALSQRAGIKAKRAGHGVDGGGRARGDHSEPGLAARECRLYAEGRVDPGLVVDNADIDTRPAGRQHARICVAHPFPIRWLPTSRSSASPSR